MRLQTTRTLVRDSEAIDLAGLRALVADTRIAEMYFGYWAQRYNLPDRYFLPQQGDDTVQARQLVVLQQESQALIGAVRLTERCLGYFFSPTVWRAGYAGEVLRSLCPVLLEDSGLTYLSLHIARENLASIRLAERLNCSYHGLIRVPSERMAFATFMDFRYASGR